MLIMLTTVMMMLLMMIKLAMFLFPIQSVSGQSAGDVGESPGGADSPQQKGLSADILYTGRTCTGNTERGETQSGQEEEEVGKESEGGGRERERERETERERVKGISVLMFGDKSFLKTTDEKTVYTQISEISEGEGRKERKRGYVYVLFCFVFC